jgi:hypothetical protein
LAAIERVEENEGKEATSALSEHMRGVDRRIFFGDNLWLQRQLVV